MPERSSVRVRPNSRYHLSALLDRFLCFMHEGSCRGVVRYYGDPDGILQAAVYAPSASDADLVPRDVNVVDVALMMDSGTLTNFVTTTMADQVYWVNDARPGHDRSYLIATEQSAEEVAHLMSQTVYFFQDDNTEDPLNYDEVVALLGNADVFIDKPLDSPRRTSTFGPVVVVEDMTALDRARNAR